MTRSECSCYLHVFVYLVFLLVCGYKDLKIKTLNKKKMSDNKILAILIISVFSSLSILALTVPSEHDRRMELIEEKKALMQLQTDAEIRKTKIELDSLYRVINKEIIE